MNKRPGPKITESAAAGERPENSTLRTKIRGSISFSLVELRGPCVVFFDLFRSYMVDGLHLLDKDMHETPTRGVSKGDLVKVSGRSIVVGIASAVLTVCSFASPAVAGSPQTATAAANSGQVTIHQRGDGTEPPAELGNPSEWGVVKIEMDASEGSASPMSEACVNASGGKWCYGWYSAGLTPPQKYCYSNYYHSTKDHHSSVKLAGVTVSSGRVDAGDYANAHRTAGFAYTCYTYYGIY